MPETCNFPSSHWWRISRSGRYAFTCWWGTRPMSSPARKIKPDIKIGTKWSAVETTQKQNPSWKLRRLWEWPKPIDLAYAVRVSSFSLKSDQRENETWWLEKFRRRAVKRYCLFLVQAMCLEDMEWYWSDIMKYPNCNEDIGNVPPAIYLWSLAKCDQLQAMGLHWHWCNNIMSKWSRHFTSHVSCMLMAQ